MPKRARDWATQSKGAKRTKGLPMYGTTPRPLRNQARPELKNVDLGGPISQPITSVFRQQLLNQVDAGVESFQRIGRRINMHSLSFELVMLPSSTAGQNRWNRFVIYYDKFPNLGALTPGQVLQDFTAAGAGVITHMSHKNFNYTERVKILMDQVIVSPTSVVNTNTDEYVSGSILKKYIPLKGLTSQWNNPSGVITNMTEGALVFLWVNDDGTLIYDWNIEFNARVTYYDV